MTLRIKAGRFYLVRRGNGSQLVYAYEISKSGERATIGLCAAWRTEPCWHRNLLEINVDDARIIFDCGGNPTGVEPPTREEMT